MEAMGLGPEEVVKVKRGCYGLVDAPPEWYLTVSEYLKGRRFEVLVRPLLLVVETKGGLKGNHCGTCR